MFEPFFQKIGSAIDLVLMLSLMPLIVVFYLAFLGIRWIIKRF